MLEEQLGPGVAEALARTAALATDDAEALEDLAAALAAAAGLRQTEPGRRDAQRDVCLDVALLAAAPTALRRRALRSAALAAGSPAGELFAVHIRAVDALLTGWHGQEGVDLPGAVTAIRRGASVVFSA